MGSGTRVTSEPGIDSRPEQADVLICADTLVAEEAVRAWLAEHGIQVAASRAADPACQAGTRVNQARPNSGDNG